MLQTDVFLPIYNPALKSREDFLDDFVVRLSDFHLFFDDIISSSMEHPEQHYIIVGKRGSGKTSLLLKIKYEVEIHPNLKWLTVAMFNEEEYQINDLNTLFERVLSYTAGFQGLNPSDGMDYIDTAISYIQESEYRILVLIDNIGVILKKLKKIEQHRLREILITFPNIRIIGTSSEVLEHFYDHSMPFFDFFYIHHLESLSSADTMLLVNTLATKVAQENRGSVRKNIGKIEAIRILAGGMPRTIIFLFRLICQRKVSDSFRELEIILDNVTAFYLQRMDRLDDHQQTIIDFIAKAWDPVSSNQIFKGTKVKEGILKNEILFLKRKEILEIISNQSGEKFYFLSERMFNIWYLMRYGDKNSKNRLYWLVKFLEFWYSKEEVIGASQEFLDDLSAEETQSKYSSQLKTLVEKIFTDGGRARDEQVSNIGFTEQESLSNSDIDSFRSALFSLAKKDIEQALIDLESISNPIFSYYHLGWAHASYTHDFFASESYFVKASDLGCNEASYEVGLLYLYKLKNFDLAEHYLTLSLKDKRQRGKTYNGLGNLYRAIGDYPKAEEAYMNAVKQRYYYSFYNLGLLYQYSYRDGKSAEKYYLIAANSGIGAAYNCLGNILTFEHEDFDKAEEFYIRAVNMKSVSALNNLACLYTFDKVDLDKAEKFFLEALEKGHKAALTNLAHFYSRKRFNKEKSLHFAERMIKHDKSLRSTILLITILFWSNKAEQAEIVLRDNIHKIVSCDNDALIKDISSLFVMMISRKRYNLLDYLFIERFPQLRSAYEPIWHAFCRITGKAAAYSFSLRPEIQDTVQDIIQEITSIRST